MATDFDSLVDSVTSQEPAAPPVPSSAPTGVRQPATFDTLVDLVSAPDSTELHASLFEAQTADPNAEAQRRNFARELNISPELVTDDARTQIRAKLDPVRIAEDTPSTAKFLSNPANAKLAIDNVSGLQRLEKLIRNIPRTLSVVSPQFTGVGAMADFFATGRTPFAPDGRTVGQKITDPVKSAAGGINTFAASLVEGSRYAPSELAMNTALRVLAPRLAEARREITDDMQASLNAGEKYWQATKSPEMRARIEAFNKADLVDALGMLVSDPGLMVDQLSQSLIYLAPGAVAARGGAAGVLTYNSVQEALDAANTARQEAIAAGGSQQDQDVAAATAAMVTAPLAFLGNKLAGTGLLESKFFTSGQTGHGLVSTVLREMVSGAAEEGGNQFGVNVGASVSFDPTRDVLQGVGKAAGVGGFLEAVHGGGMSSAELALRSLSKGAHGAQADKAQQYRAATQADQNFHLLTDLTAKAEADDTRTLDESAFHEFISTMVEEEGALKEVFVDAVALNEAMAAGKVSMDELQTRMPEVAAQLQEGLATGGDVRISLPDYLTYLAPSPIARAILPKLKVAADGLTYEDSQAFFQSQVEEDQKTAEALALEAEPVLTREEFESQLLADTLTGAAPLVDALAARAGALPTGELVGAVVTDETVNAIGDEIAKTSYEQYLAQHPNKKAALARDVSNVHDTILAELQNTGRFPRAVSAAYAVPFREFYRQNAERMGLMPSQLYQRLPLSIVSEAMDLGRAFNQPEQAAVLGDFAPGKVQDILSKHNWTILTAENPNGVDTPAENPARMEQLREYLDANGITYHDVDGHYGRPEKSVILFNVSARQALDIGRMFDQESVLTRDGLVYQDGSVNPTTGVVTEFGSAEEAGDFYSVVPELGTVFSVGIDFDTTLTQGEHRDFNQSAVTPQTESEAFKKWFGDSKVVDENGEPLVVYHSSTFGDFDTFEKANQRKGMAGFGFYFTDQDSSNIYADYGLNFQADRDWQGNEKKVNVMPVYLSMRAPLVSDNIADVAAQYGRRDPGAFGQGRGYAGLSADAKTAIQRAGYDGVIAKEYVKRQRDGSYKIVEPGTKGAIEHPVYVVFEPTQIKSAIGNIGTFDPQNPNILYQEGGKIGQISVTGVHFSRAQRQVLNGGFYGTGIRGAEARRLGNTRDLRLKSRLHFYVDEGKGVFPEGGVGSFKHTVRLDNMYDGARNPQKFPTENEYGEPDFNVFESAVLDAGFDGYYIERGFGRQGVAVMLGDAARSVRVEGDTFKQSVSIRTGKETLAKYGLRPEKSYTVREVAAALEARQRVKYGSISEKDRSPEAAKKIAKWIAEEVQFEMQHPGFSGVGWYSHKFQGALDQMGELYPELRDDQKARDIFTALIAITSDGAKVTDNLAAASDIYGTFRKTGWFEQSRGSQRQGSVAKNLETLQALYDAKGADGMKAYLLEEQTVGELKKQAAEAGVDFSTGYQVSVMLPRAAVVFGPKLGAFYANLMGSHGYLTMDRWFSRSFNRYRGALLEAPTEAGLRRFKELLGNPNMTDEEAIAASVGPRTAYYRRNFKDGSEIEKAANTIYKAAFENLKDAPLNASDRTFMIAAVGEAQRVLKRKGLDVSIADIQAILWYYEKRLYGELGARQSSDISFEEAAAEIVRGTPPAVEGDDSPFGELPAEAESPYFDAVLGEFYQSTHGWYFSQLARTIQNAKSDNLPASQWKAWLTANAAKFGVKKDEIQWTGITDWLDLQQGKISKAQISDYLNTNGVQVEEVMRETVEYDPFRDEYLQRAEESERSPKYASYVVPGGTDYRELLLTLPDKTPAFVPAVRPRVIDRGPDENGRAQFDVVRNGEVLDTFSNWAEATDLAAGMEQDENVQQNLAREKAGGPKFRSSHWAEPNILAHVRFDERRDAEGNRVLFVQEIQSDWGQQGKKEGFVSTPSLTQTDEGKWLVTTGAGRRFGEYTSKSDAESAMARAATFDGKTPTAPFVTDTKAWVALALKRMIAYAAENGFDKVAVISGEQAAGLYDLSKRISGISYRNAVRGGGYEVQVIGDKGNTVWSGDNASAERLEEVVGRELAQKVSGTSMSEWQNLSGLDLKVGGEGMRAFYDQIVPQVARDVLKKIGGAVEQVDVLHPADLGETYIGGRKERILTKPIPFPQTGFAISDEMRAKVADGLPLFQKNLGSFDPNSLTISLLNGANLSTVLHEGGHFYLRALELMSAMPEATQEMKDDFEKVMSWFGTTREQWSAMSVDEQRPYHEQWAQSQERWMLEGKSPSLEMQPIFARFRAWMLDIYKSVEAFLARNPLAGKLNDDIRGVFSRLIASENAITQAEAARGYTLLFATEEDAKAQGVPAGEYRDYLKQFKDAHQDSVDSLQQRSLRDMKWASKARAKAVRDLQKAASKERAAIREEVTKEVLAEPVNQARQFLRTGEMTDPNTGEQVKAAKGFKLNSDAVQAMYPATALGNPDLTKLKGLTAKDGLDPELLARMFGFGSGDQMIREVIEGEDPQAKIDGITEQRMLEQHGELIDQRAIEAAADEAVHNEARARFMATGLKMLTKSPISSYQLSKAAKEAAERTIAGKKVRDLRPAQYTAAEARNNRKALALVAKDPAGAADAQRAALLGNRMAQAALAAQEEVKGFLKYVSKFRNEGTRKALDLEYLEQIDQLLAAFDASPSTTLKEISARQTLAAWVQQQEEMGYEPTIDPEQLAEMKRISYKEMTVEQLRGFIDGIKEIEHLGRQKKKLLTAIDARAFAERMAEAEASIRENANRTVKERATPQDVVGQVAKFGRWWAANHRKFSSLLREMDGGKDNGVMWNLLARTMNDAGTRKTQMKIEANEAMAKIFAPIQKAIKASIVPGGLYARKTLVPGTDISLSTEQRLMFAMNWGNEGNRQRLLDGGLAGHRALSIQQAQAILDTLTKEQWDFVQATWDYIATYRPLIEEQERTLTGKTPKWVEPSPVQTKFGTYPGGYFPAKYDAVLSTRSESLEAATNLRLGMKGAFNSAATRNGYTKERSAQVINRPLLLSFNAISQHVDEVIHRISWQAWLIDANRSLRALDGVIREHYGVEVLSELRNTVRDIAQGDAPAASPTEVAINRVRIGTTIVGMGYNVATALTQPAGLAQSWSRVGGRWIARGLKEYLSAPFDSVFRVHEMSPFMANRARSMNREINEVLNTVRAGEKLSAVKASFFSMIGRMQQVVDTPTWLGAYEKGLEQLAYENAPDEEARKAIERHAIALADQAVRDSQSHGDLSDLAGVQRGGPAQKLWTNFYSYFSATYNLNVEAYRRTDFKSPSEIGAFLGDVVLLNILPVLFTTALHQLTRGDCDWDDMECILGKYAHEQISYLFGQMILLRELGVAVNVATGAPNYGYSGPAGLRFFGDVVKAGQQVGQGEADMTLFKSINNVLGATLHYPAGQINRTLEGIIAVEEGRVEGLAVIPALMFGPPRD